jgi:polyisoprenoid-binding protein YceI
MFDGKHPSRRNPRSTIVTESTAVSTVTAPLATGRWAIDPSHSSVEVVARHLVAKTRGRFSTFEGVLVVADPAEASSVEATIDASSIDTREPQRDGHLRSADFFDVENHPTITFRSTGIRHLGGDRWAADGELTVRGVTRPVTLDVEFGGITTDPWGGERAGFSATTEVDREAFGLTWNQVLETGGLLVGRKVKIEIEAELVRQADGTVES